MKNTLVIALLILGFSSVVYAAPYFRQEAGIVPLTDSDYYLGTTTPALKAWKGLIVDQICLSADCKTAWPTGTFSWTPTSWGNSTSTTLGFLNGFLSTASSTFSASTNFPSGIWNSSGNVGIGTTTPGSLLSIGGTGTGWNFFDNATTTSYAKGIDLKNGGCFALNGVCVGGAGTVTSIATTYPLTGGTITTTGTLELAFGTTTSNTWAGTQTFTNAPIMSSLSGILKGNGASALTVAANGTDYTLLTSTTCSGTDKISAVTASGGVTCSADTGGATVGTVSTSTTPVIGNLSYWTGTGYPSTLGTVATSSLAIGASLSSSGTLGSQIGGTASSLSLNMANANIWTALQTFANASSTQFSVATETFYIDSTGKIQAKDTTNNWSGRLSPTRSFVLGSATTTAWTASTTGSGYSPFLPMPFAGTLRRVRCLTDASFVGVNVKINGSNVAPSYFVASTTAGVITFTGSNTFTLGQKILADFGTTTTASTLEINCTFDVTET